MPLMFLHHSYSSSFLFNIHLLIYSLSKNASATFFKALVTVCHSTIHRCKSVYLKQKTIQLNYTYILNNHHYPYYYLVQNTSLLFLMLILFFLFYLLGKEVEFFETIFLLLKDFSRNKHRNY